MRSSAEDPATGRHFDPLLRELLAMALVEQDPDDGEWRLVALAHRRLDVLAAPPPPADKVIHFGHRCVACGEIRPTRRRPEGFVCEGCASEQTPARPAEPATVTPRRIA